MILMQPVRPYGCFNFLLDVTLTVFTGGLWLIWVVIRQMLSTRRYY